MGSKEVFKFKDTLDLPRTKFPMKANLVLNQEKYKDQWKKSEIYKKRLQKNEEKPEYRVVDGPPYANGAIHMGHAFNKILKDFVVRWKNISGFKSIFIPGWDVHGLPIENKLERNVTDFKNFSPSKKIKMSQDFANSQVKIQSEQLSKLNLSFPFEKHYLTSDTEFIEKEYLLFQELWEKGLILRENKPVAWSYSSETALAESELVYEEVECNSIYFFWRVVASKTSKLKGTKLILWTTTPYSLEANLAVAFNPELKYSTFTFNGKHYLASSDFVSNIESLIGWEKTKIKSIKEVDLAELEELQYLNSLTGEKNPILPATFLQEGKGSGLVHMAPGLGEEDYLVCKKYGINPYCAINEKGIFESKVKFEPIAGQFYLKASEIVINHLKESENLILVKKIKHKIGKDWRTGLPTFYRATKQWFLNLQDLKEDLNKAFSNSLPTHPEWLFSQLKETVDSRLEWCLSRQRAWGLPIPIIFKDGEIFGGIEQLKKNISILVKRGIHSWYSDPISFFLIDPPKDEKELSSFSKCFDVLDVWFDSGCVFLLNQVEGSFIPADLYIEGGDQLRGWFNSSSILSAFKNSVLPFKRLAAHGFILDSNGHKMSKSKGNVVDPLKIVSSFGADVFRLWVANSNFLRDIRFSKNQLSSTEHHYRKIRNILFRFSLSVLPNFDWNEVQISKVLPKYPENKYLLSSFLNLLISSEKELENLGFHKVIKNFLDFIELYSSWYLELVKPVIYSRVEDDEYKKEILEIIAVILKYSLLILSPFIPQTTEEVYRYLEFPDKKESIWLEDWDFSCEQFQVEIDKECWDYFFKVRSDIFVKLEERYSIKEIGSAREAQVILPRAQAKYFDLKTWTRLLGVAEIIHSTDSNIKVLKSFNTQCPRCMLYWDFQDLIQKVIEEKDYLLCNLCVLALKDYWKDERS